VVGRGWVRFLRFDGIFFMMKKLDLGGKKGL
jgi:hypothetical protein